MNTTFGLDIGTTTIKAVWLGGDTKSIVLRSCLAEPTPPKGMLSESPIDQENMAKALQKVMTDAKITTNRAHIALADNQVFTKVIEMPALSDKELSSAIYWEAEQYIPASLSTITLDWHVLRRQNDGKMQVLLVGAPTQLIKKYQNVCELAGISLVSIETEVLSIVRSSGTHENSPTTLLITIGAISTSFAILQKETIVFTYSVPLGGLAINRAISSEFGFSQDQAEQYKKAYGVADSSLGGKISKAIEPILNAILAEVKKALAFYNEKYQSQDPVSQILLAGVSSTLPAIDTFFVRSTGVETVIANPWKMVNIQGVPKEVVDSGSEYAIAVGLALKEDEY